MWGIVGPENQFLNNRAKSIIPAGSCAAASAPVKGRSATWAEDGLGHPLWPWFVYLFIEEVIDGFQFDNNLPLWDCLLKFRTRCDNIGPIIKQRVIYIAYR